LLPQAHIRRFTTLADAPLHPSLTDPIDHLHHYIKSHVSSLLSLTPNIMSDPSPDTYASDETALAQHIERLNDNDWNTLEALMEVTDLDDTDAFKLWRRFD
jgi:hypothetical protein